MVEMDEETNKKPLIIFGRDVSKIPCFRNSYMYGVGTGIAGGLTTFMFTSRPGFSFHCGMGTFAAVTLGYWAQCRYRYSVNKAEMQRVQALLRQHSVFEGTEAETQADLELAKKETV